MTRKSLQYLLCEQALKNITTDKTVRAYKRNIKEYVRWQKQNPPPDGLTPAQKVQRWERELERMGCSPSTIHSKIAPVCKGYGISMSEVDHPKRTADKIKRGRREDVNARGRAELDNPRFAESVALAKCTGLRRAELAKVSAYDYVRDESGYPCLQVKGKGGKVQLQRILPEHQKEIEELTSRLDVFNPGAPILDASEIGSHINYHGIRADVAREAYAYYTERMQADPAYRGQLRAELLARYDNYHAPDKNARMRFLRDTEGEYKLRGANADRARAADRPTEYDRLAALAVSVFHLSHWRLDVTVVNYLV